MHRPGEMKKNLAVIEVKSVDGLSELGKDLETLEGFLSEARYYYAIMLIYGENKNGFPRKIIYKFNEYIKNKNMQILLIWHQGCGKKPELMNKLDKSCAT